MFPLPGEGDEQDEPGGFVRVGGRWEFKRFDPEDPAAEPGRLYWYLVVGRNGAAEGPAGNASAGPRLANSSGSCP